MPTDSKTLEQQFREAIEDHAFVTVIESSDAARACASLASEKLREIEEERDALKGEVKRLRDFMKAHADVLAGEERDRRLFTSTLHTAAIFHRLRNDVMRAIYAAPPIN